MDIKLTETALRKFLQTDAKIEDIAQSLSLCGPTFDRIHKIATDTVLDIEVITNRIDTASAQGVGREAVAILSQMNVPCDFKNDPYSEKINLYENLPKTFNFEITAKELTPRFSAISLENVTVKPSPKETQDLLENCDERPINNIVDITNELTLLYGMPSHIFDLDKLAAQKLTIRESRVGESLYTLDDQKVNLKGGDIVIEDGAGKLIDLCGVMGGQVAEVDEHTKNVLLIVPCYHPKKIRQTSLSTQKRTLASQIYEKQPDPELCLPVLMRAISLFKERAGASPSSRVFDYYPDFKEPKLITLDLNWLNKFIGIDLKEEVVISILVSLGFSGTPNNNGSLICKVPSFRYYDINIKEDLAEEVARVYGYYRLPSIIPSTNLSAQPENKLLSTELRVKKFLAYNGYNEIFNNSLVSLGILEKSLQSQEDHLKLKNALSEEYTHLRTSLIPSLLSNLENNKGKTDSDINLFEVSNVYLKTGNDLPEERSKIAFASTQSYRQVKGLLEALLAHLNAPKITFRKESTNSMYQEGKTAGIYSGNTLVGTIGFAKPVILRNFSLQIDPVIVDIDTPILISILSDGYSYEPISEYPEVSESITVTSIKPVGELVKIIKSTNPLIKTVSFNESYQNNHTFKVTFGSQEKNLDQKEVNIIKEKIIANIQA